MGFFSGIRRRIKKIIPKEIRPAIPFIAAGLPFTAPAGLGALGAKGAMGSFLRAGLAKGITDDEADLKDVLRTGAIAATPQLIDAGIGKLAAGDGRLADYLNATKTLKDGSETMSIAEGISSMANPETFMGQAKLIGGQAATDFGIKQAELNEKAIEEYERELREKGVRNKADRRNAIFNIFVGAGYDDDEVNVMLDRYGYRKGGEVGRMMRGSPAMTAAMKKFYGIEDEEDMEEVKLPKKKPKKIKKKEGEKIKITEEGDFEIVDDDELSASDLQQAAAGVEAAFGRPFGNVQPVPMLRFAEGGDVDILETEEEIITPEYLMKEEGVPIQEQVSNPDKMDSLNQLSLMLFNKPIFELTEEQFEMLKEFASDRAAKQVRYEPGKYSDDEIDMYEQYKYDMNEQRPGMPIIDIDEFLRMEYGAGRLGVAKGGPIKTQKPDMEKDTKGKTAAPDYYVKRMEELMDLGYDYETAGRIAMDYDDYREAIDKGPVGDAYKQGGVIKKKKIITIGTGKLKDYPGIKKILEMNKKGKKRFSKADGGKVCFDKENPKIQNLLPENVKDPRKIAAEGGLMNLGGKELDLRGGGFVPMGKKEKADDVPARLSKNEFVMTADAVRAAGGGSVQKGADLMYDTMKKLEAQS